MTRITRIALFLTCTATLCAQIQLAVDATEAPRKILHAKLSIPAKPGPLMLVYPKWIPGEHGPTGPIANLAGLHFTAAGKPLAWKRDHVDMYAFHLEVPAGAGTVDVALDFLLPATPEGFSGGASSTANLAVVSWNQVLLYPSGAASDDVKFMVSLRLPSGWKYGTALPVARETGGRIEFQTVSLTTLVDSPVLAGTHFRQVELAPNHYLDIAADSAAALEITPEQVTKFKDLVAETAPLYGVRHYRQYHFLLTLSDYVAHFGLEHHESSDDRVGERTLLDDGLFKLAAGLLPHEMTHSWNGKYRRPEGLATPDYQQPMRGGMLWVYEGLTSYLGDVLTARSGLLAAEHSRELLAAMAAGLDHRPGRTWRPLLDTTAAAQLLYGSPQEWSAWRRSVDFYDEGVMIWLEADTIIRRQARGRSLDDFIRKFFGGPAESGGKPSLLPYSLEDITAALNEIAPYDWRSFFDQRVNLTSERAPLGGIEAAGWKVVYNDTPNEIQRISEQANKYASFAFSLGMSLKDDGTVQDVINGMAAERAGMAPGMKVVGVNGRRGLATLLHDALKARQPIELLVENGEFYRTLRLAYSEGEKYPHLERDTAKPDLLGEIWKARR